MKFSEMPYERPKEQVVLDNVEAVTARFAVSPSAEEQLNNYKLLQSVLADVDTMGTLAHIRNSIDTRDAFYEEEREFYDNFSPRLQEKIQEFQKAMIDSPYREELERTLGSLLFLNIEMELKSFSPALIQLAQEENTLGAAYQKLYASARIDFDGKILNIAQLTPYKQNPDRAIRRAAWEAEGKFFDAHQQELDDLFDKLVENRTQQAKMLGYNNFVELGYLRQRRNCYGTAEVTRFRQQVVEDLVPVTVTVKKRQAERIGISDFTMVDNSFTFKDGNATPQGTPEELLAAAERMYTEMSPETAQFIQMMNEMELFDVVAKDGKAPGGYCTSILNYNCPFIFSNFNGTSGDVDVLTHEAGHAFADYIAAQEIPWQELRSPTMEGCEVHSMSMEFLTAPWHHLFFKEQTEKYELSHLEDALTFIPYGCMVDHFQESVYANPEMTPAERNALWQSLEKEYRPYLNFDNLPFYSRGAGWQRQLHIYLSPFYYIDYCLAQTIALQIWAVFEEDPKKAWEKYFAFVKKGGTATFRDLVEGAGLNVPFEPGSLKKIVAAVENWMEK